MKGRRGGKRGEISSGDRIAIIEHGNVVATMLSGFPKRNSRAPSWISSCCLSFLPPMTPPLPALLPLPCCAPPPLHNPPSLFRQPSLPPSCPAVSTGNRPMSFILCEEMVLARFCGCCPFRFGGLFGDGSADTMVWERHPQQRRLRTC